MNEGFNQPHIENLRLLFENCFSIPVFQRPYSWDYKEINELFMDINEYFENNKDEELFMGTIYMAIEGTLKSSIIKYSIIDGQQRITTLSLICLMLYHYAVKLGEEKDDTVINLKSYLWKKTDGRSSNKEEPIMNSSSLEKTIMKKIFDKVFDKAGSEDLLKEISSLNQSNSLEQRIVSNIKTINSNIKSYVLTKKEDEDNKERLLDYIDYITNNLKFITITVGKNNIKKLFEIFESINSKGKQLDQIDLIKSYIFQNINGEDYDTYLNVWGDLIKETDDNLELYMNIFIKAFIKFYRNNITSKNFRTLGNEFINHYEKNNLSEALKALLDDMKKKVEYYKSMMNKDNYLINTSKFKFYTICLRDYEHPRPLIFRSYCEFKEGNIDKEKLSNIVKTCFSYMFMFQTISNRDSKDAIKVFETTIDEILEKEFNYENIINRFKESLILDAIDSDIIKSNILNYIGYSEKTEKAASRILLTAYEFSTNNKIDYDKAIYVMTNKEAIQIDHILPQTPEKDDENCSYYIEGDKENEILRLKKNHDFNIPGIQDGTRYEYFRTQVLDKIGNLRLIWRKDNITKSNEIVKLKTYSKFNTYEKINARSKSLSNNLIKNEIFNITK